MKIDQEYLKQLLEAFESADRPFIDLNDIEKAGLTENEHAFVFHMQILDDKNLIQQANGDPGFGLQHGVGGDEYYWSVIPLRLTADGHEFLEALRNEEVWSQLKANFKDASIDTLWGVSRQLLEGYAKKKVRELLGE
ncbi:MAG TPA: DUF2513 domain-containing protein [Gallionella sp.]|nr:DUF2513 domain-containing protein [Gallionella sp.]